MDRLLKEYADKFEDNFPIFYVIHLDEDEIKKLIKKAIDNNEPYEADYDDEVIY